MENLNLSYEIFGNSLQNYLIAAGVFFVVLIILKIFKTIIVARIKKLTEKTKTNLDDIVIDSINSIHWPFYFLVSLNLGLWFVEVHRYLEKGVYYLLLVSIAYYGIKVIEEFVDFGVKFVISKKEVEGEGGNFEIIRLLGSIIKILIWVGAILMVLSNFGINVTSMVAGLGIGGIAVALALQNILSDIFSSFSIYFDKPFKVGDFVVVGEYSGTIKKIGIKSTRIQALQGEEIVVSNQELTKSKIQNFGQMERRRVVNILGVTYNTSKENLNKIPVIIKDIVDREKNATYDRAHFKLFNNSSLDFELVYFIEAPDYVIYMDTQQSVNMQILEAFEKEKIDFAYPTQTIHLEK